MRYRQRAAISDWWVSLDNGFAKSDVDPETLLDVIED